MQEKTLASQTSSCLQSFTNVQQFNKKNSKIQQQSSKNPTRKPKEQT